MYTFFWLFKETAHILSIFDVSKKGKEKAVQLENVNMCFLNRTIL